MKKLLLGAGFSAIAILPINALAYSAGDMILRVGAATVAPNESSDDVAPGIVDQEVAIDSDTQLGLTFAYMLKDNLAIQVLAATPFSHTIDIENTGITAGEIEHLPPTVTLQYFFNDSESAFQPYIGAGINYTLILDEDVDGELNAALDGILAQPPGTVDAELKLDDSIGLALELGMDYVINDNWSINAALWYIDINSTANVTDSGTGLDLEFDVDIDPYVYMLSAAYKF